jgi:hypothetical protein
VIGFFIGVQISVLEAGHQPFRAKRGRPVKRSRPRLTAYVRADGARGGSTRWARSSYLLPMLPPSGLVPDLTRRTCYCPMPRCELTSGAAPLNR